MENENIKKMYEAFIKARKEVKNKDKPQIDYYVNKVLVETGSN